MKKFYTTASPDRANILVDTAGDAIAKAESEVRTTGEVRYVVQILFKIEPDRPPVKITPVE